MTNIKKISLRELVQKGLVKNISNLRENSSEYPFVTLLDSKGAAQNVYFGKNTSEKVHGTFKTGDSIIDFLKDADVVETQNAEGETRFKLSVSFSSEYASEASLNEIFGIEANTKDFDFELFNSQFTLKAIGSTAQA